MPLLTLLAVDAVIAFVYFFFVRENKGMSLETIEASPSFNINLLLLLVLQSCV